MSDNSLENRMDKIQFHLLKAEELTEEWWASREEMDGVLSNARVSLSLGVSSDFFLRVAEEAIREERRYISQINYHRNRAKRLMRRYEKHPRIQENKLEMVNYEPMPEYAPTTTINNVYPMEKN